MTSLTPFYNWRYLPRPEWIVMDARGLARDIALVLSTDDEDHVVLTLNNPRPGVDPDIQPALELSLLNHLLEKSLRNPGGLFNAVAAETLFLRQARLATDVVQVSLLAAEPPKFKSRLIQDLLHPSLGWLLWGWQMEVLIRTARCPTAMSRELTRCCNMNYPRTKSLMAALSIGRYSLQEIRELASPHWDGLENMTAHVPLTACFQ